MNPQLAIGALLALLALAWMVRAVRGIRRRRLTTYGHGGFRHTHHGRLAVWAGVIDIGFGVLFFLLGIALLYLGSR